MPFIMGEDSQNWGSHCIAWPNKTLRFSLVDEGVRSDNMFASHTPLPQLHIFRLSLLLLPQLLRRQCRDPILHIIRQPRLEALILLLGVEGVVVVLGPTRITADVAHAVLSSRRRGCLVCCFVSDEFLLWRAFVGSEEQSSRTRWFMTTSRMEGVARRRRRPCPRADDARQ